jgi:hypothetical protein
MWADSSRWHFAVQPEFACGRREAFPIIGNCRSAAPTSMERAVYRRKLLCSRGLRQFDWRWIAPLDRQSHRLTAGIGRLKSSVLPELGG